METGKEKLLRRDFAGALQCFNEARGFRHSFKLILVCLALKIAPGMFWRIYGNRRNRARKIRITVEP